MNMNVIGDLMIHGRQFVLLGYIVCIPISTHGTILLQSEVDILLWVEACITICTCALYVAMKSYIGYITHQEEMKAIFEIK
jgi:hypothetical protein